MSNPTSGTYDAIISSEYYCWGDACEGKTKLNWSCTDQNCDAINISGNLPAPSIIPQTGSPSIDVTLPTLTNVGRWLSGNGTLSKIGSTSCASGTMSPMTEQTGMKFVMSENLLDFCKDTSLSAQFQVSPFVCSRIPFTGFNYCYSKHHPHNGFFAPC